VRKVTIRISDELFKKLGHYCVDADKSVNRVMTELLEKLLAEAIALYARVSTKNNGQDPETQLIAMQNYAAHRGFRDRGQLRRCRHQRCQGPQTAAGQADVGRPQAAI